MKKILWSIILLVVSLSSCNKSPEDNDIVKTREETFADLPGWKFRVKVYAEKQTVADYGGEEEFIVKVDELFEGVSRYFCSDGINDGGGNQMHFFMTEFEVFEGASSSYTQDENAVNETGYDLRVVINEHALDSDAASGWYRSPCLSVGLTHKEGVFSANGKKLLAKYLAISRGAYDISQESLTDGSSNWTDGTTYTPPACITNDPGSAECFSDYAKAVIDFSGEERIAKAYYELIPQKLGVTVKNTDGSTRREAYLKFYPIEAGNGKLAKGKRYSGGLSEEEVFFFSNNPFLASGPNFPTNNLPNFVIEVNVNGFKHYAWMPMHEIIHQYIISGAGESFIYKIDFPGYEGVIPKDDYICRAEEFDKLPGWKFRCKIMGESKTVEDCGGRIPFMEKVDVLLAEASKYFQVPGINDAGGNQVHFFMTEMVTFEGLSQDQMYDDTGAADGSYDLRIIFNANRTTGDVSAGYLRSPYLSIGHDNSDNGGLWGKRGLECLVHELGHARGVMDLYAAQVPDYANPVSGRAFTAENSIMNSPYGNTHWCDYSLTLINASAGNKIPVSHESTLPEKVQIKVLYRSGSVINGATIRLYPVYSYSAKVEPTPLYEGVIADGKPFEISGSPFMHSSRIVANYLVEMQYGDYKSYRWMPVYRAMTYVVENGYAETYPFTFQM